jgi:5-methylcytosine-specific restriction endonuclease McrA
MRRITKAEIPAVLAQKQAEWTQEYIAEPGNGTKKYRYRHGDIKSALVHETASKCVYCESKIGHNTPGDVEHNVPSSADRTLHFAWANLTIACTECNRRKLDYFDALKPFLDPYHDDVEGRLVHLGPVVCWHPGDDTAEITVKTLELNETTRKELISRKVETIDKLNNVVARLSNGDPLIQELMKLQVSKMKSPHAEFSGMIRSVCNAYGL